MLSCTNKGKVRRELDLIQKRNGHRSRTDSVWPQAKYSRTDPNPDEDEIAPSPRRPSRQALGRVDRNHALSVAFPRPEHSG